jgi:hypothetical protein
MSKLGILTVAVLACATTTMIVTRPDARGTRAAIASNPLAGTWDTGPVPIAKLRAALVAAGYANASVTKFFRQFGVTKAYEFKSTFYIDHGKRFRAVRGWDPSKQSEPSGSDHGPYKLIGNHRFVARGVDPPTDKIRATFAYRVTRKRLALSYVSLVEPGFSRADLFVDRMMAHASAAFPYKRTSAAARSSITYTARVFMRGMTATVPSGQWKVYEDQPGEFNLQAPSGPAANSHIHFWLDPLPTKARGVLVHGVKHTPTALIAWLRHNPNLLVSSPVTRRIAGGRATKSVNLDLKATAPREDPSCPGPCLTYFKFRGGHYDFPFGTTRGEPVRLYFARLGDGRTKHTFAISVDAPSAKAFHAVIGPAEKILTSITLPANVSAG